MIPDLPLPDLVHDREAQRAAMSVWSVLFTLGSALILGHRIDRFLARAWKGRTPFWYPVDGVAWAAVAFAALVLLW